MESDFFRPAHEKHLSAEWNGNVVIDLLEVISGMTMNELLGSDTEWELSVQQTGWQVSWCGVDKWWHNNKDLLVSTQGWIEISTRKYVTVARTHILKVEWES